MPKKPWLIDWRIEGTRQVLAADADEAQELFDKGFGSPNFLDPLRDGEVSNDPPCRNGTRSQTGGNDADKA
ncbi:hypothetical protein B5M44_25200 [Shinella sumterensis]|uniref:hypothetical protein n=1 Tax=Shinella sumterensis TaxID=1967501 RepID=UPI00106EBDAB|nr:hypothetical protein [Shinella sumterensis]MCD1265454.1 hypothetical protein [Shinella sumterensis]TFE93274.1 hypothetical protein B5M44_25200 [Shinella sumterensis]